MEEYKHPLGLKGRKCLRCDDRFWSKGDTTSIKINNYCLFCYEEVQVKKNGTN